MRDAITLFERELARCNGHTTTPGSSGFMGMMEREVKSFYDLLPTTPGNTDSESDSEGSYRSLRECNMLRLSEDGAAPAGGTEDDANPIRHTTGEQAEYDQERLERARAREVEQANKHRDVGCPSPQHLDAKGARAQAHRVYDQIQQGNRETPIFPRAN
jgi:hypothetical protein